ATPLPDVLGIDLQPASPLPPGVKYYQVVLTDGSVLQCAQFKIRGTQVELTLAAPETPARPPSVLTVPLAALAHLLGDAQDPAVRQEWQDKYLARRTNED